MRTICQILFAAGLMLAGGCATTSEPSQPQALEQTREAFGALNPATIEGYNNALGELVQSLETQPSLRLSGVATDWSEIGLNPKRLHVVKTENKSGQLGVPVVIEYDTSKSPFHPPEGLFINATAVFTGDRLSFVTGSSSIQLKGRRYPLASESGPAERMLAQRARPLAKTGFSSMVRPEAAERKPRVYMLDPYDPNKIPLLMVHGLQSTPVAFAGLVQALKLDPLIREKYQVWQFYYASGTPVLYNALSLRLALDELLHQVDPFDQHNATKRIVVLGHSMGGVISHTLVSSSGERVWDTIFRAPPERIQGDRKVIQALNDIFHFRRNPRVSRVIFIAAPHRGSPISDSLIGSFGNGVTRLPGELERAFVDLAAANPDRMTEAASKFYTGGRVSSIRTLSKRSAALIAVSKLPIGVPHHSIIGQVGAGAKENGSDGVVPYSSSHLDGADSELVVRTGHMAFNHPEAKAEVIRILRLELGR